MTNPAPDSGVRSVTLVVPACLDAVRSSAAVVRSIAETVLSSDDANNVEVVAAEIGNNIVIHAFGGEKGTAEGKSFQLTVERDEEGITLEFTDDGPPFDPVAAPAGTPEASIARGGGGLGLFIMRKVMDELAYRRTEGRNVLRLRKLRRVDPLRLTPKP